jgi:protein-S-isoprenylcysteine O-methyltransferase Ste14
MLFAVVAASTGANAARGLGHALAEETTRTWLVALYGVLRTGVALAFALFTVGRDNPQRPSRSPVAFGTCAVAIAAVIAFAAPSPSTPEGVVLAGDLIAVAFCVWLFVSVLFLGRCFGVLPEARGLVTSGPYRLVRHPVYLGEIGACVGLAIASPSLRNTALLCLLAGAQAVRMGLEEEALARAFPRYVEYAARTPQLIPRLRHPRASRHQGRTLARGKTPPAGDSTRTARGKTPPAGDSMRTALLDTVPRA